MYDSNWNGETNGRWRKCSTIKIWCRFIFNDVHVHVEHRVNLYLAFNDEWRNECEFTYILMVFSMRFMDEKLVVTKMKKKKTIKIAWLHHYDD